jgi:hypothetical protein
MVWLLWTVDPSAGEYTLGEAVLVRAPDVIHDLVATGFLGWSFGYAPRSLSLRT